jgi:two-component system, LytTR family, sensor kinase
LKVIVDAEPEAMRIHVPNLLLQPLVENAIRHGASVREGLFHLRVEARIEKRALLLVVADDGPGLSSGWDPEQSNGLGLRNTCERLRQAYGSQAGFELKNGEAGGLRVSITIPIDVNAPADAP